MSIIFVLITLPPKVQLVSRVSRIISVITQHSSLAHSLDVTADANEQ